MILAAVPAFPTPAQAVSQTSADATTLGVDAAHTYSQPTAAVAPPLGLRWSAPISGTADYPIVAGGRVFATVHHPASAPAGSTLVAFDVATGHPSWAPVDLGGTQSYAGLTYDQGSLFAVNFDLAVTRFDPALGVVKWSRSLAPGSLGSAPVALGGRLYVASASNGLFALDEASGATLWRGPEGPADYDTVAATPQAVYVTNLLDAVALRPSDGTELWNYYTGVFGGGQSEAAISGGRVYISSRPHEITLDPASGHAVGAISDGLPAFGGNFVFTAHGAAVHARDAASSRVAWNYFADATIVGRPVYAGGYLFILSAAGTLRALNATNGTVAWSTSVSGVDVASQITVGDDQLVVTTSSAVMDFAGSTTSLAAPAPLNAPPAQTPPQPSSDQSSGFQGGPTHTGTVGPDSLTPPLHLRWSVSLGRAVMTPLLVGGSAVIEYVPADGLGAFMIAYDLSTGKRKWGPVDVGGPNPMIGAYNSGRIFALTPDGVLRAFDVTNGAPLWATGLAGVQAENQFGLWAAFDFDDPPVAADGFVFVRGAGDGSTLFAVHGGTGSLAWKLLSDVGVSAAAPAVNAKLVFLDEPGSYSAAYDVSTGTAVWRSSMTTVNAYVPPAVGPTNVYSDGTNHVFNASTGAPVRALDQPCLSPTLASGRYFELVCVLYNGKYSGRVDAHDPATGNLLWSFTGDGKLQSAPFVVNGELYVASSGGTLYYLNATTGHLDGSVSVGSTFGLNRFAGEYWWTMAGGQGVLAVPIGNRMEIWSGP